MLVIDACGLSCPQPVLLVLECIRNENPQSVCVFVDNEASHENVTRAANNNGYRVSSTQENERIRMELNRS